MDPRATPAARFALGAAFFLDARFSFLRSVLSVIVFVFICPVLLVFFYSSWIPANFSTSFFSP
jgi:hypothetical protein